MFNYLLIVMGHKNWCKNPHTRGQIILLVSQLTPNWREKQRHQDPYVGLFVNNVVADKYLMFSLIRVFIDAERTGAANQFYEKFNLR